MSYQICLKERYDTRKAAYLLQNWDNLNISDYTSDPEKAKRDLISLMRGTTLKKGYRNIKYAPKKGVEEGRLYSKGTSLQGICKVIRHTISGDLYWDVDIVNAHPVLLLQYCQKNCIECYKLQDYVENREEHLVELMSVNEIMRSDAKNYIIKIINGGSINKEWEHTQFLDEFYVEMKSIREQVVELNKTTYERTKNSGKKYNIDGSTISFILQELENLCLQAMFKFFTSLKYIIGVLCFDGLMLEIDESKDINSDLIECAKYVENKTRYKVTLALKEMNIRIRVPDNFKHISGYEIPSILPTVIIEDSTTLIWGNGDEEVANKLLNIYRNKIKKSINNGIAKYYYLSDRSIWVIGDIKANSEMRNHFIADIHQNKVKLLVVSSKSYINRSQTFNGVNSILSYMFALVHSVNDFENLMLDSCQNWIHFENGAFNFENKTFHSRTTKRLSSY